MSKPPDSGKKKNITYYFQLRIYKITFLLELISGIIFECHLFSVLPKVIRSTLCFTYLCLEPKMKISKIQYFYESPELERPYQAFWWSPGADASIEWFTTSSLMPNAVLEEKRTERRRGRGKKKKKEDQAKITSCF